MGFRPERIDLPAAIEQVRKRLGIAKGERDNVRDAIREGRLPLHVSIGGHWEERDGAWFQGADVWWPNPYMQSRPGDNQISVFDIMVNTADLDKLWPHAVPLPSEPHKSRGGRNARWDWEGALIELARLERVDGIENKLQADLVRHLGNWFSSHSPDGSSPADSEIRARVKRYQESLPET